MAAGLLSRPGVVRLCLFWPPGLDSRGEATLLRRCPLPWPGYCTKSSIKFRQRLPSPPRCFCCPVPSPPSLRMFLATAALISSCTRAAELQGLSLLPATADRAHMHTNWSMLCLSKLSSLTFCARPQRQCTRFLAYPRSTAAPCLCLGALTEHDTAVPFEPPSVPRAGDKTGGRIAAVRARDVRAGCVPMNSN